MVILWITFSKPCIRGLLSELFFWNECKKTLERDLPLEEYSTWISPLLLRENVGTSPKSYSILAPNKFILDWVEENYGESIKDRISAITSNIELNLNFEVFEDGSFEERPNICFIPTATLVQFTTLIEMVYCLHQIWERF